MAKKEVKNDLKKGTKNSKKEEKKVKNTKKVKKEKVKKENYFEGVRSELSKVKWPSKQEVLKYTVATIVFVVVLVVFFILLDLLMSAIKGGF